MKRIKIFKNLDLVVLYPTDKRDWFNINIVPSIYLGFGCGIFAIQLIWFYVSIEIGE